MARICPAQLLLAGLLCSLFALPVLGEGAACLRGDHCYCQFSKNEKIDLTNITSAGAPGTDIFLTDTVGNLTYFYHGCTNAKFDPAKNGLDANITNAKACSDNETAVCVYNATNRMLYNVAEAQQSEFHQVKNGQDNMWELLFKRGPDKNITIVIELVCSPIHKSYIKAEEPNSTGLKLVLFSAAACVIKEKTDESLSTGSILLIMFFTAAALYLVGGAMVLHFLRGARGIEMVPNLEFWKDLPFLVRDGIAFLLNGCRPTVGSGADVYDRI